MKLEQIQAIGMHMISRIGLAKSNYIESMSEARLGQFENALKLIEEGNQLKNEAHGEHLSLIQSEASGNALPFSLILMHAEDQLLTCEVYHKMALEQIHTHQRIQQLEAAIQKA